MLTDFDGAFQSTQPAVFTFDTGNGGEGSVPAPAGAGGRLRRRRAIVAIIPVLLFLLVG